MRNRFFAFILAWLLPGTVLWCQKQTVVEMKTSMGKITLLLYDETPGHRDNFVNLARQGFYDGVLFHRVIKDFMIQGGDPFTRMEGKKDSIGEGGPGYDIPAEFVPELFHRRGALAAARNGDDVNPERASGGSQFYIVQGKKYKETDFENIEKRVRQMSGNQSFVIPAEHRKVYMEEGGTPWLDSHYTVYGRVIKGIDVVDAIAAVKVNPENNHRPLTEVKIISTRVKSMKKSKINRMLNR